MVLYFIYLLPSVGFEFSACCGSLTITFNKYISLLYLKRLFVMQNFFTSVLFITSSKRKSSSSGMFYKIDVLKIFTKFTGKHLYGSLFLEACNFVKTKLRHRCFFVFLQNT